MSESIYSSLLLLLCVFCAVQSQNLTDPVEDDKAYNITTVISPVARVSTTTANLDTATATDLHSTNTEPSVSNTTQVPTTELKGFEDDSIKVVCPLHNSTAFVRWHKLIGDSFKALDVKNISANAILLEKLSSQHNGLYRCSVKGNSSIADDEDHEEVIAFIRLTVVSAVTSPPMLTRRQEAQSDPAVYDAHIDSTTPPTLPKYSGIAIGLGVCGILFLLSGGAVCILNLSHSGGISFCVSSLCWSIKKDDYNGMSRLANDRASVRSPNSNVKMLPLQRMVRSGSDAQ